MIPKIIGIAGTNGSGKDTVGQMLAKRHGWVFVSVGDVLRDELKRRQRAIERKNLRLLSAQWRREHGLGVLIDKSLDEFSSRNKLKHYGGLVIASLRNPGEADRVHELGGKVVWVDADPKIRYQRINSRLRSTEDHKTYEEFREDEQDEMQYYRNDEATLNLTAVKGRADIFIENSDNDIEDFKDNAEKALRNSGIGL